MIVIYTLKIGQKKNTRRKEAVVLLISVLYTPKNKGCTQFNKPEKDNFFLVLSKKVF
jgi:hypothetical protein